MKRTKKTETKGKTKNKNEMKKTETKREMKDKPKMKKNDENDFF